MASDTIQHNQNNLTDLPRMLSKDDLPPCAEKAPDFNPRMRGATLYDFGHEDLQVQTLQCETQ